VACSTTTGRETRLWPCHVAGGLSARVCTPSNNRTHHRGLLLWCFWAVCVVLACASPPAPLRHSFTLFFLVCPCQTLGAGDDDEMHSDEYDTDASGSDASDSDGDDDMIDNDESDGATPGAGNSADGPRQRQRAVSSIVTEEVFREEVEHVRDLIEHAYEEKREDRISRRRLQVQPYHGETVVA